jgi:acetoin utilization protein AcuB
MYVGLRMMRNPVVCTPDTGLDEAVRLMKENKVRQLPVIDNQGHLAGLVSDVDLQHVLPSPATSLSVHEMTYLLSKLTVAKFMVKKVITIGPEATIEEAALLMHDRDISGLPVVKGGKLVGYINRTIMLELFVEEMGLKVDSSRITLELEDKPGQVLEIARIIKENGLNMVSVATFYETKPGMRIVVFRVGTKDPSKLLADLAAAGHRMVTAQDFDL